MYHRFVSREVYVGNVVVGGDNPIVIQSMTTTDTMDTEATVTESIALFEAGCQIVRITAPGPGDAENLGVIRKRLHDMGYDFPLVADIHFAPRAAMIAIEHVEKVRINPGNFVDSKKFKVLEYTDEEYAAELSRLKTTFEPLALRAKKLGRALRIGTNHGSLSDRIMNRFGDTPRGMVESALEYLRIACDLDFFEIIVSMKASNPQVMIQAYRLLVEAFYKEGMNFPLHLGVTEAGSGQDGRIKSAIGIGSLLSDGLGDTIRVSLTEDSVNEIPAAQAIANPFQKIGHDVNAEQPANFTRIQNNIQTYRQLINPYSYQRYLSETLSCGSLYLGSKHACRLIFPLNLKDLIKLHSKENLLKLQKEWQAAGVDALYVDAILQTRASTSRLMETLEIPVVYEFTKGQSLIEHPSGRIPLVVVDVRMPAEGMQLLQDLPLEQSTILMLRLDSYPENSRQLELLQLAVSEILETTGLNLARLMLACRVIDGMGGIAFYRLLLALLEQSGYRPPIFLIRTMQNQTELIMQTSTDLGALLLDGIGDALCARPQDFQAECLLQYHLDLLQATRLRLTKTEFISCPSCGRTLFDLQSTTTRIQAQTGHLKGVKIAIMGCIVNGPGEMADADFGYVGAGPGHIHLYRGKELVKRNIPAAAADQELIELIKEHSMWQDPD